MYGFVNVFLGEMTSQESRSRSEMSLWSLCGNFMKRKKDSEKKKVLYEKKKRPSELPGPRFDKAMMNQTAKCLQFGIRYDAW